MVCHNRSHNLNHMKYFTFFFLLITLPTLAQTEAFYVQKLAQQLGGQTEVSVKMAGWISSLMNTPSRWRGQQLETQHRPGPLV